MKFSGVTILQGGVEFSIFLLISEWVLQQCSATALPVIWNEMKWKSVIHPGYAPVPRLRRCSETNAVGWTLPTGLLQRYTDAQMKRQQSVEIWRPFGVGARCCDRITSALRSFYPSTDMVESCSLWKCGRGVCHRILVLIDLFSVTDVAFLRLDTTWSR